MNEEIEKVYVELVDTLKKHPDVKQEHIDILKEQVDLLERRVSARDELIKVYEQVMQEAEVSGTAIDLLNKAHVEVGRRTYNFLDD